MPSNLLRQLRAEAEKVSPTNAQLLAHWRASEGMDFWKVESTVSGQRRQEATEFRSALVGVGGSIGLIGIAMANAGAAAAAVGVGGVGASTAVALSTALSSLGTVAIAGAALPVAPVIAFGIAAAGAAGLLISKCMAVDISGGIEAAREYEHNLEDAANMNPNGRSGNITASDWLRGAKNLIARGIAQVFGGRAAEDTFEMRHQAKVERDAAALQQRWDAVKTDVVRSYMLSTGMARDVFIRCAESDLNVLPPTGLLLHGAYDDKKGGIAATVMDDAMAYIEQFPADFKIEAVPGVSPSLSAAAAAISPAPRVSRPDVDWTP